MLFLAQSISLALDVVTGRTGTLPDMMTRLSESTRRRKQLFTRAETDNETPYINLDRQLTSPSKPEFFEHYDHILDAITTLPAQFRCNNPSRKFLRTQVPTFRGNKDYFNEIENLLRNNLLSFSNRLMDEAKLHYLRNLLQEEAIEFFQFLTKTTETTLIDVLTKFSKDSAKDDLKEVAY